MRTDVVTLGTTVDPFIDELNDSVSENTAVTGPDGTVTYAELSVRAAQLAERLRIKQPSLVALEQSEAKGSIELATLRRVAEALDCTLVYALVPNKPLEKMVRDRARLFTRNRRRHVEHTMLLEDQPVRAKHSEAILDEVIRETNPRLFWD